MTSLNRMASSFIWRWPCITVSHVAASTAVRIRSGSEWPKKCTPMPEIRSNFTDPSASSTSGPLPRPDET